MARLADKCALVTGAAQGIGAAIARAFAGEGAGVLVTDSDADAGVATAREIGAEFAVLDVREEADWQRVAGSLERLDILVNNAGITGLEGGAAHDPENAGLEDWRAVHRTNLDGVFLGCKYGIRTMRKSGGGAIINVSSRSGLVGIPAARPMRPPRRRCATTPRRWRSTAPSRGSTSAATPSIRRPS